MNKQYFANFTEFIQNANLDSISPTAYDTSWAARIPCLNDKTRQAFPESLTWLLDNQLADGSWGSEVTYHHHDRVISTLGALATLLHWQEVQKHQRWQPQIERAHKAARLHLARLREDVHHTIGFELIAATLLEEVESFGLAFSHEQAQELRQLRDAKLRRVPQEYRTDRRSPTCFSLEFLGPVTAAPSLHGTVNDNGSVSGSPSATAYALLRHPELSRARDYLADLAGRLGGGLPAVAPIDGFEPAWVLFNLIALAPKGPNAELAPLLPRYIAPLQAMVESLGGVSFSSSFPLADCDDTAAALRSMAWCGCDVSPDRLRVFATANGFRTYPYEMDLSTSTNVHVLWLLDALPANAERDTLISCALRSLEKMQTAEGFWTDKWHASPYYVTSHAVIAMREAAALRQRAVDWIIATQHRGDEAAGWGYYGEPSAEETAYCLQALICHRRYGGRIDDSVLDRGALYLSRSAERASCNYKRLWIGKSLYTPTRVVDSAVTSALALVQAEGDGH